MTTSAEVYQGATVGELIAAAIDKYPDRTAFANDCERVTYAELGARISQVMQHFDRLGLKSGDTVAQLGVNRFEVFVVMAAAYLRGLRSVMLHALGGYPDHEFILNDCGARAVVVDEHYRERGDALRAGCRDVETWMSFGAVPGYSNLNDVVASYTPMRLEPRGDAEQIIRIAYTGGTTGRPKGVMQSNRAISTNIILDLSTKPWPADVRYLCVAPMSHGAGSLIIPTLVRGGCVTLLRSFSADAAIDAIGKFSCNVCWMVPTMLYALLDSTRVREVDWSKFHTLVYSAAPTAPARIRQALQTLGPILVQSYGQTEAPNSILILDKDDHARLDDAQLAAAGRPYPLLQVRLLDADGAEVPRGNRGELCVRGPLLMSGYLNNPEETEKAFADGWLRTGDIAYLGDDGLYYLVDRRKDLIISGGFNIYPKEIEDTISIHPAVAAAAVIGVPDPKWGEMVLAYVQPKPGCSVAEDEIQRLVRERNGSVAVPKRVEVVASLPLTALGKIDKKALRARHWGASDRAVN